MTGSRRVAALALAAGAAGALAGCGDADGPRRAWAERQGERVTSRVELVERLSDDAFRPEAIYAAEGTGVVTVISVWGDERAREPAEGEGDGLGSGFVLSRDGEIATNAHVVLRGERAQGERADEVYVEFADGNQVEAEIVGTDPNADIALLRVDPAGLRLRPLPLAPDDAVRVGAPVAALGSPFGERQSLSVGIVSALDRSIPSLTDFRISGAVQTDAAINPGNSGGPLLDAAGEVVGVNQQIRTRSGGGEGVGFAVPVRVLRRSLRKLRATGEARYAYLGASSVPLYPQLQRAFSLPVRRGAWLQEVAPGGPGERAGLRGGRGEREFQARAYRTGGDVVVGVDATPVGDPDDLASAVSAREPGERVALQLWRDGRLRRVEVELAARPQAPGGRG